MVDLIVELALHVLTGSVLIAVRFYHLYKSGIEIAKVVVLSRLTKIESYKISGPEMLSLSLVIMLAIDLDKLFIVVYQITFNGGAMF